MHDSIAIAFRCFSDIKHPETYEDHDDILLLPALSRESTDPKFGLTEWWKIAEGGKLTKPFNVGDELVEGLLHALKRVSIQFI